MPDQAHKPAARAPERSQAGRSAPRPPQWPARRKLAVYEAQNWPDLHRGMVITVYRPWRWTWSPRRLFWMFVAWRIRRRSGGLASHAMIYAGSGKVISQDAKVMVRPLADYTGCRLTCWSKPYLWAHRNQVVAEAMVRVGRPYSWRGLFAHWLRGAGLWSSAPAALDEPEDICSEMVCEVVRKTADPGYCGNRRCASVTPAYLDAWMAGRPSVWRRIERELV